MSIAEKCAMAAYEVNREVRNPSAPPWADLDQARRNALCAFAREVLANPEIDPTRAADGRSKSAAELAAMNRSEAELTKAVIRQISRT